MNEIVQRLVGAALAKASEDPAYLQELLRDRTAALRALEPGAPAGAVAEAAKLVHAAPLLRKEEMSRAVRDVLRYSATAFTSTLFHCRVLFWTGLFFAVASFVLQSVGILALPGGLASAGVGFSFVYAAFLQRPLDRIQRSAGNLAQAQIIFLGFLDQIAILMSRNGSGPLEERLELVDRIGAAVEDAADRIERFCEGGGNRGIQAD